MRRNFLILMLMALLPLAGFAEVLDQSKFSASNINYGTTTFPTVSTGTPAAYTASTDYTVDETKIYKNDQGTESIPVANLATTGTGTYYVKINGAGEYASQDPFYIPFLINGIAIEASHITISGTYTYIGSQIKPTVSVAISGTTLNKDVDYTLDYGDNVAAGTNAGSVTVKGIGSYSGTPSKTFDIGAKTFSAENVTIAVGTEALEYTGHPQAPTVTVTDKVTNKPLAATDFEVYYKVGSATATTTKPTNAAKDIVITVKGKGNYTTAEIDPNKKFDIDQATVLVTPSAERNYDGQKKFKGGLSSDPTVTYKYQGFVNGETEAASSANVTVASGAALTVTTDLNNAQNAGTYALTVDDTKFTAANYTFVANQGTFTIKPIALTVTAEQNKKVTIGTADKDIVYTVTLSGNISSDAANLAVGKAIIVEKAAEASEDGSYVLTPKANPNAKDAEKTTLANYTIDAETGWVKGKLTYTNGKLTIAINETKAAAKLTKVYDGTWTEAITLTKDELTFTPSTVDVTNLTLPTATIMGIADAKGKVDKYQVKLSGAALTNYDIKYISSNYEVTKRPLTININAQTIESDANPATEGVFNKNLFTVKNMVENETNPFELELDAAALATNDDVSEGRATTEGNVINGGDYIKLKVKDNTSEVSYSDIVANYSYTATVTGKLVIAGAGDFILDDNATIAIAAADVPTTAVNVTFSTSRTFKPQQWYAMVLPFEVSVAKLSNAFGYAVVNRLNTGSTTANHVAFGLEMQKIPANEPFLIKIVGEEQVDGTYGNVDLNGVTIPSVTIVATQEKSVGSAATNQFTGNYTYEKALTGDKIGFLSKGEWVCPFANTKKLQPMDAYLQYSVARTASSPAPLITVEELDGTVTAISQVKADEFEEVKTDGWYSLNGVRLQGVPTQKGIYIHNGKKIVIK